MGNTDVTLPVPEAQVADYLAQAAAWIKGTAGPRPEFDVPYRPPDGIRPWNVAAPEEAELMATIFDDLPWSTAELLLLLIDADGQAVHWKTLGTQVGSGTSHEVARAMVEAAQACHRRGRRLPVAWHDGGDGPSYWFDRGLGPFFRRSLEHAQQPPEAAEPAESGESDDPRGTPTTV